MGRGGWSDGVLQGVLDAVLRDVYEAREGVVLLLGSAGRRGDWGGKVGELEVVCRLDDCSPKCRATDGALGSGSI
jgi:hypothetical protein